MIKLTIFRDRKEEKDLDDQQTDKEKNLNMFFVYRYENRLLMYCFSLIQ